LTQVFVLKQVVSILKIKNPGDFDNRRDFSIYKAPVGVEPTHGGFAIRCLSHLATAPQFLQIELEIKSFYAVCLVSKLIY
jgi:hypothetical protein